MSALVASAALRLHIDDLVRLQLLLLLLLLRLRSPLLPPATALAASFAT